MPGKFSAGMYPICRSKIVLARRSAGAEVNARRHKWRAQKTTGAEFIERSCKSSAALPLTPVAA
jgi:hypothetical protein